MKKIYLKHVGYTALCLTAFVSVTSAQTSTTFSYTGSMQTFTVPACVTSITVDAMGSKGGDCIYNQPGTKPDDLGGLGGRVVAVYPVTPGQVLNIFVGGLPYNGGGTGGGSIAQPNGGGASDIRIGGVALTDRVIVAGGGGGGGNNCSPNAEQGGAGGGLIGGTGYECNGGQVNYVGTGGTQSAGGTCIGINPGTPGTLGIGGNAGGSGSASGGGGGGYYGGAGSGFGGAGGGSSYTDPSATSVVHTQGYQNGNGQITLTYSPGIPLITVNSTSVCSGSSTTLNASGIAGLSYTWNTGASTASISVSPTVTTSYTVSGTNACGTGTAVATVSVNTAPTISVSSTAICSGNTATLIATGSPNISYLWNVGITTASISVSPTVTTSYTVTGTGTCGSVSAVATVTLQTIPTVTAVSSASTICANSPVTLTANGSNGSTYMWNTGATTASISVSPAATTVYTVTATNTCGTATATVTQSVSICTGIAVNVGPEDLNIYPNPAKDQLFIHVSSLLISNNTSIEISDALGKLVRTTVLTKDNTVLNIDNLEDGIYFFKVISNTQVVKTGKIVKQSH